MRQPWIDAFALDQIAPGSCRVLKQGRTQVAVFHLEDGQVLAIDNRCPHEGYPLNTGDLKDCTLTCSWHNYKFDLRDGACLMGEEAVRSFPVRVVDGRVQLDLTPPDPALEIGRIRKSVAEGLSERQLGRVARDVLRWLDLGGSPEAVMLLGAAFDGARGKWGSNHGLAVCADALRLVPQFEGPRRVIPLVQALDMVAEACVRLPVRARPAPESPGPDPVAAAAEVRRRVEHEEAEAAEALFAGCLDRFGRDHALGMLFGICADHLLDFGHGLIYVTKAAELLAAADRAGAADPAAEADLLGGLLYGLVCGTREDVLPAWKPFTRALAAHEDRLEAAWSGAQVAAGGQVDVDALAAQIADADTKGCFVAAWTALEAGARVDELCTALELAACQRMLRFDTDLDADRSVQDNWLSITHLLTRAHAVRAALPWCHSGRDLGRHLLLGVRFVNHARPLDLAPSKRRSIQPRAGAEVGEVVQAIVARDECGALDAAAGVVQGGGGDALVDALGALALGDNAVRPIVVTHLIKLVVVAADSWRATGRAEPLLAVVRVFACPPAERRVLQRTLEAIDFVQNGRIPTVLAS